jgi:hypothetical protein
MKTRCPRLVGSLLLLTSGCFVDAGTGSGRPHYDDRPYYDEGTLIIDWSIAGIVSPYECRRSAADSIAIIIETTDGRLVDEFADDCEAFATSFTLPTGNYVATVLLLDAGGYDRTTAISAPVRISGGYETELPVDFPPSSFY